MFRVLPAIACVVTLAAATAAAQPPPSRAETIRTEFRVFNGTAEVSSETRLRVRPSGSSETGQVIESGQLAIELSPGIYDVQAVRQQAGQVTNVRWAERLVIMAYPDERGRHLEVINFANDHGALQLRWPEGRAPDPAGIAVTVTRTGESRPIPTRTMHGLGYLLLVVPAGTYDVRLTQPGREPTVLTRVEVPADSTRMKLIQ